MYFLTKKVRQAIDARVIQISVLVEKAIFLKKEGRGLITPMTSCLWHFAVTSRFYAFSAPSLSNSDKRISYKVRLHIKDFQAL